MKLHNMRIRLGVQITDMQSGMKWTSKYTVYNKHEEEREEETSLYYLIHTIKMQLKVLYTKIKITKTKGNKKIKIK